jgi:predicted hotdog family 3-hydroxylacyl-ACP dehydratase
MRAKPPWQSLIPHQGAMCLLDDVIAWDDARIHACAISHRDRSNPLCSGGRLHAVHLCEYGAQAMAVHGGLLAQRDGRIARPGLLASLRAVTLQVARIDDLPGRLDVVAEKLVQGESAWQYAFAISHAGQILAQGRATVVLAQA